MNTPMHLTIITGASRGMGLAMAGQLLREGHQLLCIPRRPNPEPDELAAQAGMRCEQWPHDLARSASAAAKLETWLAARDGNSVASATLINNAGTVPRVAPLSALAADDLADALRIDLEAPMLLTSAFLRATQ